MDGQRYHLIIVVMVINFRLRILVSDIQIGINSDRILVRDRNSAIM